MELFYKHKAYHFPFNQMQFPSFSPSHLLPTVSGAARTSVPQQWAGQLWGRVQRHGGFLFSNHHSSWAWGWE